MKGFLTGLVVFCAAAFCCAPSSALAGPNAGGVIALHNPDLAWTEDTADYCGLTPDPTSCPGGFITRLDGADPEHPHVWKAYALFPPGSSPRLKAMAFGIHYDPSIVVVAHGPCVGDLNNGGGEISGPGWPGSDTGTAIVFQNTLTAPINEFYWFAGYNESPGSAASFCLRAHPDPVLGGTFADDSIPSIQDRIAAYGCLGFDTEGSIVCPNEVTGACCRPDGSCTVTEQSACPPPGIWAGPWTTCDPNPCPQLGACCYPDGHCEPLLQSECPTGDWRHGIPCDPNPCDQPGACCVNGGCIITTEGSCEGTWQGPNTACDPNPCPPGGACCYSDGHCRYTFQSECPTGDWRLGVPCDPNPCPPPPTGACCNNGECTLTTHANCHGEWQGPGTDCDPNPCPPVAPCNNGLRPANAPPARGGAAGSIGAGHGIVIPNQDSNPCPPALLCLNFDGSAENAYCWQYGGIVPPYYGAFAECCDIGWGPGICGIQLLLTGVGYPCGPCDVYVWADHDGCPGTVLSVTPGLNPCPVATWPSVSTHDFRIQEAHIGGVVWFGYWADFSNQPCGYFVAADTNGFGGCPYTCIAPGIGYPTGWASVSVVWGATQSIGIGAWLTGESIPVKLSTWGRIKHLYW